MPDPVNLDEIKRLLAEATPGPWAWGKDWSSVDAKGLPHEDRECSREEKYLGLELSGAGETIIDIGVDHYEPIWDSFVEPGKVRPSLADRALIVALRNSVDALVAEVERLRTALRVERAKFVGILGESDHACRWPGVATLPNGDQIECPWGDVHEAVQRIDAALRESEAGK